MRAMLRTQLSQRNCSPLTLHNMINITELMAFRIGGRLPKEEYIVCGGHILTPKKQFTYLRITLQVSGTTFSMHIKERLAAAIRSISDIRHLHRMSLETVMKLFRTKVLPTLTYGLEQIWEFQNYLSNRLYRRWFTVIIATS